MESDYVLLVAIIAIVVCLLATIIALLIYSGLFASVEIRAGKPPFENLVIAYKFARGPYKNAGALFTEVSSLVPQLKCIGMYYDDPKEVSPKDLRYIVGAILSDGGDNEDSNQNESLLTQRGFKVAKLPAVNYALNTTFPFKNTLSIFLAVGRVYPKLDVYMKEKKLCAHPMIEVYDDDIIHFVAPLSKQEEFYVPEANEEPRENVKEPVNVPRKSSKGDGEESNVGDEMIDKLPSELSNKNTQKGLSEDDSLKDGSGTNGSGEESTGSSFEELNIENGKES